MLFFFVIATWVIHTLASLGQTLPPPTEVGEFSPVFVKMIPQRFKCD